jgi:hypothetical protein
VKLPGFTAEFSMNNISAQHRHAAPLAERSNMVIPASCFGDCFQECIKEGSKAGCSALCTAECGEKPRDNPGIPCTPVDNSVNHNLCIGGITAWHVACVADCSLFAFPLGALKGVEFCLEGCGSVAEKAKADCPPKSLCLPGLFKE